MSAMIETIYIDTLADGFHGAYTGIGDLTLIAEAKTGDQQAFEELCRRHSNKLMRCIRRILRDGSDAEDVLQETLLSAFTHLKSFEGRSSVSTWLTRIAINAAFSKLRGARRGIVSIDDVGENSRMGRVYILRDRTPDPESQLIQQQKKTLLVEGIGRLPTKLRKVVELRIKQEYSGKQIADKLGISESAVKSRLSRAHLRLRSREGVGANGLRQKTMPNCGDSQF